VRGRLEGHGEESRLGVEEDDQGTGGAQVLGDPL